MLWLLRAALHDMDEHALSADFVIGDESLDRARGQRLQKLVFLPEFHCVTTVPPRYWVGFRQKHPPLTQDYTPHLQQMGWPIAERRAFPLDLRSRTGRESDRYRALDRNEWQISGFRSFERTQEIRELTFGCAAIPPRSKFVKSAKARGSQAELRAGDAVSS